MTTVGPAGHLAAIGLVAVDLAARTARLTAIARLRGTTLRPGDSLAINLWADLGSALTPMRLGGEPARLAGLRAAGVRIPQALETLAIEAAIGGPVTALAGIGLAAAFGHRWWREAAPLVTGTPWYLAAIGLAVLGGWLASRRYRRHRGAGTAVPIPLALTPGAAALLVLYSLVNVASRVAILPVLAATGPAAVPLGSTILGAFVLIHGQLVAPTPAGAGVIDAAFLAGAAGRPDPALLLAWRFYTTVLPGGLGALAAWHRWQQARRRSSGHAGNLAANGGGTIVGHESVEHRPPTLSLGGDPGLRTQALAEPLIGE